MTQIPSLVRREAGTSQPAGRKDRRRWSASHALVALAVVLAFVLNILALQDRSASVLVAVADRYVSSGETFQTDMVRLVPIPADFDGLASLITEERVEELSGWVLQRSLGEGDLLDRSALAKPAASDGLRSMSIPVDATRAAGGTVVAGDRVDVIAVEDGRAAFVVSDVAVLSVPVETDGTLGGGDHYLVVAVDAAQALALAEAMAAGVIDVIRSTGAEPPDMETLGGS